MQGTFPSISGMVQNVDICNQPIVLTIYEGGGDLYIYMDFPEVSEDSLLDIFEVMTYPLHDPETGMTFV